MNAAGKSGGDARTTSLGRGKNADFPRLIAITDLSVAGPAETLRRFSELVGAARPRTVMISLRDRTLGAPELLSFGRQLAELSRQSDQWFQVNDRLDMAMLLGADSVHLGEASVETRDARRLVGERFVTRACHDVERVVSLDADGVLLSPIFEARKGRGALGLGAVATARRLMDEGGVGTRLYALGGVEAEGAEASLRAGADGVAAIGAALSERGRGLLRSLGIGS